TAHGTDFFDYLFGSIDYGQSLEFDQCRYAMCRNLPNIELTPTCAGYSRRSIVAIRTGADDGRITYATITFVGHSAGGCTRRQVAFAIQCHSTHGAKLFVLLGDA